MTATKYAQPIPSYPVYSLHCNSIKSSPFLPRCMQCRRGIAMRILSARPSVRPSVRLSHACIVTKRKKDLSRLLYHTKDNLA